MKPLSLAQYRALGRMVADAVVAKHPYPPPSTAYVTILVTGSRNWPSQDAVDQMLDFYAQGRLVTLVTGGCRTGADPMAQDLAKRRAWTIVTYPAKWDVYGKKAGPIRNQAMLDAAKPDLVIAFITPGSKGTLDTVRKASKLNIPIAFCTLGD